MASQIGMFLVPLYYTFLLFRVREVYFLSVQITLYLLFYI